MNIEEIAITAVLSYLEDGKSKQPHNFDKDFLCNIDWFGTIDGNLAFNKSAFGKALRLLVAQDRVKCWKDVDGWHYQIA